MVFADMTQLKISLLVDFLFVIELVALGVGYNYKKILRQSIEVEAITKEVMDE